MKGDKKKLIVVAALGLVILGVGVVQVMGGSSEPPPVAGKKQSKKVLDDAAKVDPVKNPLLAANLAARDPFQEPANVESAPKTTPAPQPATQQKPEPRPGPLPDVEIRGNGFAGNAPLTVQAVPEAKFSFTLSGVMLGEKPMAVFTDAQGNQRLVLLGGSLDPDSQVVSISKDAVAIKFHGKNLRLTVEGNPNGK